MVWEPKENGLRVRELDSLPCKVCVRECVCESVRTGAYASVWV